MESLKQLPTTVPTSTPKIQFPFPPRGAAETELYSTRKAAVKAAFTRGWNAYKDRAWGKDEVGPLSGNPKEGFGGLGATLVDSLDTLWIMGMHDEFNDAVNAAMNISVEPENLRQGSLSVFETTIRYLGGLIAAYDLPGCKDQRLLNKAVEFGDMLYAAWDTPNHSPMPDFHPHKAARGEKQKYSGQSLVLIGSEALEFTRLSQLTGDMRYFDAVQRMIDVLYQQQGRTKLPGLWPLESAHEENGGIDFTKGTVFTLGAQADSTYEYLLKMAVLLGGTPQADGYGVLWRWAMDTAVKRTMFRPMIPHNEDILLPGRVEIQPDGGFALHAVSEHLECFLGGMFAMGSKVLPAKYFGQETHMMIGRKLTNGCVWAYRNTPTGIAPESWVTLACGSVHTCQWNETLWAEKVPADIPKSAKGFVGAPARIYYLRPEAIESVFYMYRTTGDGHWQDIAWEMFQSIDQVTKTEFGNAALEDVFNVGRGKRDSMESFWFAETLKYFYLIFSDSSLVSLDEFVFNTEGHPFRKPRSQKMLA